MNELKHKIISHVNIIVVTLQKFAFHQHYNAMITNGCFHYGNK